MNTNVTLSRPYIRWVKLSLVGLFWWWGCAPKAAINEAKMVYPSSVKVDKKDTYFGQVVEDPYVWLEHLTSDSTQQWISQENKTTNAYIQQIPYKQELEQRLEHLWNYERYGIPFKKGNFLYYSKNNGLQNQHVVYRKQGDGKEELFIDPNTFSSDGTTSLTGLSFSRDASLVAYSISEGGSDWNKVIVMTTSDKRILDTIEKVKFSSISWWKNEGFYYSTYETTTGNALSVRNSQHQLFFHTLGIPQKNDRLIFGKHPKEAYHYVRANVTQDERYLIIYASQTTYGGDVFIQNLAMPHSPVQPMIVGLENEFHIVHSKGDTFWMSTDYQAPNSKLVKFQFGKFDQRYWQTIIPEKEMPLSVSFAAHSFFASYLKDANTQVIQWNMNGKMVCTIELPAMGSASGFSGEETDDRVYYSFTNYTMPATNYVLDPVSGKSQIIHQPHLPFSPDDYVSKQVFYTSTDGTKIPMTISHRKDLDLSKPHPLLLYGYGGFNISITPRFSPNRLLWMQLGGIYAVANIRGGGEYGETWHAAGTKQHKKQVFHDFIQAAEYTIAQKLTSKELLAIEGRSNGGLLVGACMTMRPDLFKVALPIVGVLDMLKYQYFTAGSGWSYDYGRSDDSKEMFEYLFSYSPLHRVQKGVCYPATLVMTADHDDRVVPSHSYKFVATLQEHQHCPQIPVLISIQTKAGHGAGKSTKLAIEDESKLIAFSLWNMGISSLPKLP